MIGLLASVLPVTGATQPDLLPNERAFAFSARALDERTLEARFSIAPGYYLYRDKLRFTVQPTALTAVPALPAGRFKEDEYFGRVETFWDRLVVRLPLERAAPGERVTVTAESQGCADGRVCYPPQVQAVTLTLPAAGAGPTRPVDAAPAGKRWFN